MRYAHDELVIKSENAAQGWSRASQHLTSYLESQPAHRRRMDFGCGKLRYSRLLAQSCDEIYLVDSKEQLTRTQRIGEQDISIEQYTSNNWPHSVILEFETLVNSPPLNVDFILCSNVLSAIPSAETIKSALEALHRNLSSSGTVLITNQHANSYFKQMAFRSNAKKHLHGWILEKGNNSTYYGIIDKTLCTEILENAGFSIEKSWISGQSNYILARS